jgi:hypothetical protein
MATRVRAHRDESLGARIVTRRSLHYAAGADTRDDRPGHVRAGSGLVRFGTGLAIVQDDADFVALIDSDSGTVEPVALPRRGSGARQFDDERGNKAEKLDFEACVTAPLRGVETLFAFGSGSTPARESILVLGRGERMPRVIHAPGLYAALREQRGFSGSELNIEGAVFVGSALRLFQRGNGAPRDGLLPVNATCDVPWQCIEDLAGGRSPAAPAIASIVQFDLGGVSGIPFTFTDATVAPSGDAMYLAAAEASPDAVRDGVVIGAALGVIRATPERIDARYVPLLDESGVPVREKAEGVALGESPNRVYVVLDVDDPRRASELCVVELTGPW